MFPSPGLRDENMIHEFRLSPLGKGGISCDEGGAFVGAVPMLVRTHRHGRRNGGRAIATISLTR
jgi:hypothetical protein